MQPGVPKFWNQTASHFLNLTLNRLGLAWPAKLFSIFNGGSTVATHSSKDYLVLTWGLEFRISWVSLSKMKWIVLVEALQGAIFQHPSIESIWNNMNQYDSLYKIEDSLQGMGYRPDPLTPLTTHHKKMFKAWRKTCLSKRQKNVQPREALLFSSFPRHWHANLIQFGSFNKIHKE